MSGWVWIEAREARALHQRLLVLHGGASGVRDPGLLESELAHPRQLDAYGESVDAVDLAAAYTCGIVKNHPFVDGNKRVGFVVGVLFLEMNGLRFAAPEADAAQVVLDLAAGILDEAGYVAFLRENIAP